jgi:quercetin dioxygenase-like cupin family protein
VPPSTPESVRELEERLPGRSKRMGDDQAGVHRTATVDFIVVLSGRISLELDDGVVELAAGDCLVQNGTRHAWRNNTDQPCTLAVVLIGSGS